MDGPTDRQMDGLKDGQMDKASYRVASPRLKQNKKRMYYLEHKYGDNLLRQQLCLDKSMWKSVRSWNFFKFLT